MKLVKCVVHHNSYNYQQVFYKMGETVEEKSSVLLGFKDSLPVITNTGTNGNQNTEKPSKKVLKVQVDPCTGEKFINLNGKKLKMIPESQIQSHLNLSKRLKVVGKMPVGVESIHRMQSVGIESHMNLNKTQITNTKSFQPYVLKESNFISLKNSNADKDSKHMIDNIYMNEITADNKRKLSKHMSSVSADGVKCNSTYNISSNKLFDMKDCCIEKSVQTVGLGTALQLSNNLKDIGIQTDVTYIQSPVNSDDIFDNSFLDSFSNDALFPDLTLWNLHSVNPEPLNSNIAAKFNDELKKACIPDHEGNMPIHIGILTKNFNLVKRSCFILNILNQTVDFRNNNDLTPLQLAVIHDADEEIVDFLLSKKANLQVTNSDGNNIIHLAVIYERTTILSKLLLYIHGQSAELLNQHNHEGFTPLIICCLNGSLQCAESLLLYNADINLRDLISGRTALFHAAERQDLPMVNLLLDHNADTKIKNFFGTSAHDAMYEIEETPQKIKNLILGRTLKRKCNEDTRGMAKFKRDDDTKKISLKTYARYEKINDISIIKNFRKT